MFQTALRFFSSHLLYNPRKIFTSTGAQIHKAELEHTFVCPLFSLAVCLSEICPVFMAYSVCFLYRFFCFAFYSHGVGNSSRNHLLLGSRLLEGETFSRNFCFSRASKCLLYVTSFMSRCLPVARSGKGINGHFSVMQ